MWDRITHPCPLQQYISWSLSQLYFAVSSQLIYQCGWWINLCTTGPWFNKKMSSYQYRKSHCGDKTVVRSSYLQNGISYIGKMTSLCWIRDLGMKLVQYNNIWSALCILMVWCLSTRASVATVGTHAFPIFHGVMHGAEWYQTQST